MKKILVVLLTVISVTSAFAKGPSPNYDAESIGIVTPDIATGMFTTDRYNYDSEGDIIICNKHYDYHPRNKMCTDSKDQNAWIKIQHSPPSGKKYVGFKSVSGYNGYRYIEVYWK